MRQGLLAPLTPQEVRLKNPLALAFVGDTVFDLYVRTCLVAGSDAQVHLLHKQASAQVNAHAQALQADKLLPLLNEDELSFYKRGRNARVGTVPKNMEVGDYHKATGVEALLGALFLSGQAERLEELMGIILTESEV